MESIQLCIKIMSVHEMISMCSQKSEHPPLLIFTLFFEMGPLTEPGARWFARVASQQASGTHLSFPAQHGATDQRGCT